ncbi:GNAT family N-acetyltransferase [Aggregatilinea lenta]|uniref:GNAT family N-acetyltransferase n=1 Tax=Aggregatilinea lenta TaxID=913108 RepID=UPI000E5AE189|nr:GNAT family N-acetyltransferase [Aggregatilinea lenta]
MELHQTSSRPVHNFTLVPVGFEHVPALLDVYRQCEDFLALGPQAYASIEMVKQDLRLSQKAGGLYRGIVNADGQIVGVLDVVPGGFEGDPAVAFVELLMIAVPFRGRGLGEAVLAAAEAEICANPAIREIQLGVQVNNPGGLRFWRRMGYTACGEPEDLPDGTRAMRFRKGIERTG